MICILIALLTSALVPHSRCNTHTYQGSCNVTTFHESANACLAANNVADGTEFLFPVLEDDSAVINFCTRTLMDIKSCLQRAVSDCSPYDPMIHTIFGHHGSHLLAAYDGICSETSKAETMTCAYHHRSHISTAVRHLFDNMYEINDTSKYNICSALHGFRDQVLTFVEDAVHSNHCYQGHHVIWGRFLETVEFKCLDIATKYYPCTAAKLNSDAVACYASSSVTVRSALVPAPGLAHADVMCSSKGTILNCVHNHLARCMSEEQVSILGTGKEYAAAYECMCALHNSDMVLSCPSTADVQTAMNKFMNEIHTAQMEGDLNQETLCSKMMVMKSRVINAINTVCMGETDRMHWNTFLSTITYPCTEKATPCYPHTDSGSDPNMSLKMNRVIGIILVMWITRLLSNL